MTPPRRPVSAVLLDLDGTLVDSREGIVDAFLAALAAEGLPAVESERICRTIGAPLDRAFVDLTGRPDLTERLRVHYRARYDEVCVTGCRLMPGVAEALPRLAAAARLAVVTTKRGSYPPRMLDGHGVGRWIAAYVGADSVTRLKPDPEPVLLACRLLGVDPSQAAMVGDTPYDVLAARRAGAYAVGVVAPWARRDTAAEGRGGMLGGHAGRAELEAAGAHAVVETFADVPGLFGF